jgi:transposase
VSKARLVITAVTVENRPVAEVVADYGVARSWVYELLARYRDEGEAAFEPRSQRPHTSPGATPAATVELVLRIRKNLVDAGLDAGAETIGWHLTHRHHIELSRATINRILVRAGTITPDPSKRPKASYLRFEASMPNECWQSDFTHYRLTTGIDVEVITWLDDHSRYALHISAHPRVTAQIVLATFRQACDLHGYPASTLTDNGMVYTTRYAGGRGGETTSSTNYVASTSSRRTADPTTPPPAAKSNASNRPSRNGSGPNPTNRRRSPTCRPCSTPSPRSTTSSVHTGHCHSDPPRPPPTTHARKQPRPGTAAPTATTESASSCSSKTSTSASSTQPPANSSESYTSTPDATTNPKHDPKFSTAEPAICRSSCPVCPETSHW